MPEESKIIMSVDKCWVCGCRDTVCRLGAAEEQEKGILPKDTFLSLEKMVTPLFNPQSPPIAGAKGIMCHYDVCAKCGHRYCTRAEKIPVNIKFGMPGKGNLGGLGDPRFG